MTSEKILKKLIEIRQTETELSTNLINDFIKELKEEINQKSAKNNGLGNLRKGMLKIQKGNKNAVFDSIYGIYKNNDILISGNIHQVIFTKNQIEFEDIKENAPDVFLKVYKEIENLNGWEEITNRLPTVADLKEFINERKEEKILNDSILYNDLLPTENYTINANYLLDMLNCGMTKAYYNKNKLFAVFTDDNENTKAITMFCRVRGATWDF